MNTLNGYREAQTKEEGSPSATKQLKRTVPIPLVQEQGAAGREERRAGEKTEEITVELLKWEAGPNEV